MPHPNQPVSINPVAIVVQGAFLVTDSIGHDAVFQFKTLSALFPKRTVALFAETHEPSIHPGVFIRPYESLQDWLTAHPGAILLYHFCDGWPEFETIFLAHAGRRIVRWHNNTPPWFYADDISLLTSTLKGYRTVLNLLNAQGVSAWVNSEFSARQLDVLLSDRADIRVVYPASGFLEDDSRLSQGDARSPDEGPLQLLFVSRVVAHKGHKHIIAAANLLEEATGRVIRVNLPGRRDVVKRYNTLLSDAAGASVNDVRVIGEVSSVELRRLYENADVFVCMSEHEGFGLPVFEAMRQGVPVVAWAVTALEDLLQDHPLAFARYDLPTFAAAISIAADNKFRARLIGFQQRFLDRYNKHVLAEQMSEGLADSPVGAAPAFVDPHMNESDRLFCAETSQEVERRAQSFRTKAARSSATAPTHDFGRNYVSLYDIEAYEILLRAMEAERYKNLYAHDSIKSVRLAGGVFTTNLGKRSGEHIVFTPQSAAEGYIVFGPYIPVPPGRFRMTFHFDLPVFETIGAVRLEIAAGARGAIASCAIPPGSLNDDPSIEADFTELNALAEFRVWMKGPVALEGFFKGVTIRRVPFLAELERERFENLRQDNESAAVLRLEGSAFTTQRGARGEKHIRFEKQAVLNDYLVYGPYIHVPRGCFRFRFHFSFDTLLSETEGMARLEIATTGRGTIASRLIALADLPLSPSVDCEFADDSSVSEFRVWVEGPVEIEGVFEGVTVERVASLADLPANGRANLANETTLTNRRPAPNGAVTAFGRLMKTFQAEPRKARRAFADAERAAHAERWDDAAHAYERGLLLAPDSVARWLAYGDACMKRGDAVAAERAYGQVLKLQPDHAEAQRRLGVLLRRKAASPER